MQRINHPEPGHYWWITEGAEVVGFAMQSPPTYSAGVVPASPTVLDALAEAVFATAPFLPGVIAEAATAARFAGRWTECANRGAAPVDSQRIYVLGQLCPPADVPGARRLATSDDLDLVADWALGFSRDTGMPPLAEPRVWSRQRVGDRRLWIWDCSGPVAMALANPPIVGVTRIGFVYTPPEHRRHGYASALVSAVSALELDGGATTCMLYAQLANPTSNAIYRRIGYRPISDVLSYSFSPG